MEAMRTHPESEAVHEMACCALYVLIFGNAKHMSRAVNAGAIGTVTAAMRKYEESEVVHNLACVLIVIAETEAYCT